MKRIMKKQIAFALALFMLIPSMLMMGSAADIVPLRYEPCPKCNGPMYLSTDVGPWNTVDFVVCPKNPNYNDQVIERRVENTMTCANCSYSYSSIHYEQDVRCTH